MNPALGHFLRRPWLRELLLLALVFKALIPAGYMADTGSDGLPTLKLCDYYGVSLSAAPGSGGGHAGSDTDDAQADHAVHGLCPQALSLLPVMAPPAWMAVVASTTAISRVRDATDSLQFYRSPTPHSRLPRGPPALI